MFVLADWREAKASASKGDPMRPKSMILILIALGCGLVATIGVSQVMKNSKDSDAAQQTEPVVVSIGNIDIGQTLTKEVLKVEDWPRDRIPPGAIKSLEDAQGKYARQRMYTGEPLLSGKMMDSSQDDATQIPPGYRVKAVKVTDESNVGNLVKPGDRVDVIATLKSRNMAEERTKTILRNVRVFAVNSLTSRTNGPEGEEGAIDAKTVSLLVKPSQVQLLVLAEEIGKLDLSLRHPNDTNDEGSDDPATLESLLGDTSGASESSATKAPMGLAPFLKTVTEFATAEKEEPKVQMVVMTPDTATTWEWSDVSRLPLMIDQRELGARAPQPAAMKATPPAGAGATPEPIGLEGLQLDGLGGLPLAPAGGSPFTES